MRLFNNLFGRRKSDAKVERIDIPRSEIERAEIKRFEPLKFEPKRFTTAKIDTTGHWRDLDTGEIHEFDISDFDAFCEVMTNRRAQLIFD